MGLVMNTGSVKSQLEAMNGQLNTVIANVGKVSGDISSFRATADALKGETYSSVRGMYGTLHDPVVKGIREYVQVLIRENNSYKSCINSHLSGIGYVDEDELKKDRASIKQQISYVQNVVAAQKGSYSSYLSCLQNALNLVEKKLQQIEDFKGASAGLYQGMDGYSSGIKNGVAILKGKKFNKKTRQYEIGSVDIKKLIEILKVKTMAPSSNTDMQLIQRNEEEEIENIRYPEEYKAAQLAGLRTNGLGLPIINSATEAQAYMNAWKLLGRSKIMDLPEEVDGFTKRYEDFRRLTDTTSNQYLLQQLAVTDEYGFRRINVDGLDQPAYMVAMGSYYTEADSSGVVFAVTLENGNTFYCVAGDMKADIHTNAETHQYTYLPQYGVTEENADIIEFIMDVENPYAKELLPESEGGKGYGILNFSDTYSDMNSPVVEIRKLDISPVLSEN